MLFKDFMLDKDVLKTDKVKVGEYEVKIRELTGSQRSDMLRAETTEESCRIAWNGGLVDEKEHLTDAEFSKAFNFRYTMVNDVVLAIAQLSGYLDDLDETEKN